MKKILSLFILIFSVTTQAQTFPTNPTPFGKISINTNTKQNSATRVLVQDSLTKQVNWVLKSNFSLDSNVLHRTGNETWSGFKTANATSTSTATTGFHFENSYNGGVGNILNSPLQLVNNGFGIGLGAVNVGSGWLYSGANTTTGTIFNFNSGVGATGDQIAHNVNNVKVGGVDYLGRASYPSLTAGNTSNTSVPQITVTNGSNPSVIEFPKTGFTMNGTVGSLGSYEMNMSTNMDYTSSPGVHKFYDNTKDATWLAIFPEGWQMQWMAASGASGDVWNAQGQPRQFIQYRGMVRINTTAPLSTPGSTYGDSMFGVRRNAGFASISGENDLAIEGGKTKGVSAPVFINSYNSADVGIAAGGGKVGIGTNTPNYNLQLNSPTNGCSMQFTSLLTGSTASDGFALGINTSGGVDINQLENNYIRFLTNGSEKLRLHASGGVSVGNTTDLGAGTLNVTGNISTIAGTTANHAVIKSQLDLKADLASPPLTGTPTAPTATAGTNTTQIATTAFVAAADANNIKTTGNQSKQGSLTFNPASGLSNILVEPFNNSITATNTSGNIAFRLRDTGASQGSFQLGTASAYFEGREFGALYLKASVPIEVPNGTASNHTINKSQLDAVFTSGLKVYNGVGTQTGTSAPTVTVLGNNTIGSIVWTRTGIATYVGTLTGAFPSGKTQCYINNTVHGSITFKRTSTNTVEITTSDLTGSLLDGRLTDNSIKIEVYP